MLEPPGSRKGRLTQTGGTTASGSYEAAHRGFLAGLHADEAGGYEHRKGKPPALLRNEGEQRRQQTLYCPGTRLKNPDGDGAQNFNRKGRGEWFPVFPLALIAVTPLAPPLSRACAFERRGSNRFPSSHRAYEPAFFFFFTLYS